MRWLAPATAAIVALAAFGAYHSSTRKSRQAIPMPSRPAEQAAIQAATPPRSADPQLGWQSDWNQFILAVSPFLGQFNVSPANFNAKFGDRDVTWTGTVKAIITPTGEVKGPSTREVPDRLFGTFMMSMSPSNYNITVEEVLYKLDYGLFVRPKDQEWPALQDLHPGDQISFRTRLTTAPRPVKRGDGRTTIILHAEGLTLSSAKKNQSTPNPAAAPPTAMDQSPGPTEHMDLPPKMQYNATNQPSVPAAYKEDAAKTYATGLHYYIWRATTAPVASSKIAGLSAAGADNWLVIPVLFKAKSQATEPFSVRMKLLTKASDTGKMIEVANTTDAEKCAGKTSGTATAVYLPTSVKLLAGAGEATIYLIKTADKDDMDAKPISNTVDVKIEIQP